MKYLGLIVANLRRNKLRTALTGGAIMLAVVLLCALLTMPAALDALLNTIGSNTRISIHNKVGFAYPMPYSFIRKVRQVDGVAAAVAQMWFGGAFEEAGHVTFPNFALEAEHAGAVYPDYEIPAEQLADFQRYRDGAIVGRQTMRKYGWKIGDRVTLRSTVWPLSLDFRIVGEIPKDRATQFWMNWTYLDEALKAQGRSGLNVVPIIWARVSDAERVGAVMQQIDDMSRNSEAETASETEKSFIANFFRSLQGFITIVLIVTGLVVLCIVFIAANTASMGVRERAGEIAVLKAIGFSRRVIFGTLLAEATTLSSVAGGVGVAAALGLTHALQVSSSWNNTLGPLGNFVITAPVIVQGLFLSLFVGMLAGVVPSWGAAQKAVIQTLHDIF